MIANKDASKFSFILHIASRASGTGGKVRSMDDEDWAKRII